MSTRALKIIIGILVATGFGLLLFVLGSQNDLGESGSYGNYLEQRQQERGSERRKLWGAS